MIIFFWKIVYTIQCLERASKVLPGSPLTHERIVGSVNEEDQKPFVTTVLAHQNSVNSAEFSPDGNQILTTSSDNTAKLWYTAEGFLKWLKENNDKVPQLTEENKKKYGVED